LRPLMLLGRLGGVDLKISRTLQNWRFCQLQSHVTQKLGQISKIWPDQI